MSYTNNTTTVLSKLSILFLSLTLAACVTVEESLFDGETTQEEATEARVKVAIEYLRKEETTEAIRHLSHALKDNPGSFRVHEVLAIAFEKNGDLDLTEKHYKKALNINKNFTRGRNNYAAFLYKQKRYQQSLKHFQEVVTDVYYENRSQAFVNLGRCAVKVDDMALAESSFVRAVQLDKRQYDSLVELSEIYYYRGEFEAAQKLLKRYRGSVYRASPKSMLLGIRLANEVGDQDAIASYTMALKNLHPNSEEYRELQRLQTAYE